MRYRASPSCLPTMPRGPEVPESIRNQIVGMRRMGGQFTSIGTLLDVKANTAQKIFQRWEETGDCSSAPRSDAPKKLTETDLRHIKRHIQHDRDTRRQLLQEIINDLNLEVSTFTLKRAIVNNLSMGQRIQRKTSWLSSTQKAKRLE